MSLLSLLKNGLGFEGEKDRKKGKEREAGGRERAGKGNEIEKNEALGYRYY